MDGWMHASIPTYSPKQPTYQPTRTLPPTTACDGYTDTLEKLAQARGVQRLFGTELVAVDGKNKSAVFKASGWLRGGAVVVWGSCREGLSC